MMKPDVKMQYLKIALVVFGLIFIFAIWPLMFVWPSGWEWIPPQAEYEQMIVGIYATLGIFLIIASKNPLEHHSLIWFTVWSSVVHATIMLVQSLVDTRDIGHLFGDVPALYIVAIVLAILMPRKTENA